MIFNDVYFNISRIALQIFLADMYSVIIMFGKCEIIHESSNNLRVTENDYIHTCKYLI